MTLTHTTTDAQPQSQTDESPVFTVTLLGIRPHPQLLARLIRSVAQNSDVYGAWMVDDQHLYIRHSAGASAYRVVSRALVSLATFKCRYRSKNLLSITLTAVKALK